MNSLRRSVMALLLELVVFFNIERLDIGAQNVIDLATFVYVLAVIAVLAVISLPVFRRATWPVSLLVWLGVYAVGKVSVGAPRPILGGIYTYETITEIVLLSLSVVLARKVAYALYDFEEAVRNITLSGVGRHVRQLDEALEDVQTELIRSRRYKRPLSVLVIEPKPESIQAKLHLSVLEVQQAMMARYVVTSLARLIGKELRRTDLVLELDGKDRFIILCPETDAKGSAALANRLCDVAAERLKVAITCGIASFPEEALTFEELVRQAEVNLQAPLAAPPVGAPAPAEMGQPS